MALLGIAEDIGFFVNGLKWQSECIDPNRPGWLPKWIPTLEEKACQFGLYESEAPPDPPMIDIAAPETREQMTNPNLWDPLIAARQTRVDYIDDVNRTIDQYNQAEKDKDVAAGIKTLLFVGVAAFAVGAIVFQFSSPPRRRR